jgi:subtilisin-like proprotein convertase family protein
VNGAAGDDPLLSRQWHLNNTVFPGEDIDVFPAWAMCGTGNFCRGEGIRIAIVDDGLEIRHEDLAANVATGLSYNYNNGRNDPTGKPTEAVHGTSVAGVVAARDFNGLGVRGVAPRANLVGYNLMANQASATTSNEADAAIRGSPDVHISNNSWGPPDGYGTLDESDELWRSAIASGLVHGRGGKGTIYLWAGGNGARGVGGKNGCLTCVDNSNYDGYANHHGIIAVCAVGNTGFAAVYSEAGANLLLCAPSSYAIGVTTTDRSGTLGFNTIGSQDYPDLNYTDNFGGTSSATPIVAGVVALMLQANPNLGWRDVRKILADTARVNHPLDPGWALNGVGYPVHHRYGFGVVDAAAAVATARGWTNLGPELTYSSLTVSPNIPIPDNDPTGVSSTINVSASGINKIESVEVTFSASHPRSGDLEITLTSPMGGVSILAERHDCAGGDTGCSAYNGWVFSSVRHLNEAADGDWTLTVKDLAPPPPPFSIFSGTYTGIFQSWRLKIYGRAE